MCAAAVINQGTTLAAPVPGHVEAWGSDTAGQATPPADLTNVVAIAAGSQHSLALRVDGTVAAWGYNFEGQTNVPAGLSNVTAISAANHSVALRRNGTVVVWGSNEPAVTNVPPGLTGVMAISAGNLNGNEYRYTVAVRSNGTVVAWGAPPRSSTTNVPAGLNNVIQVAAGWEHVLALRRDGTVVAWGENFNDAATPPPGLNGVVAVRAGYYVSFALKADGSVVGWGADSGLRGLTGMTDVQVGGSHAIALGTNRQVIAEGSILYGAGSVPEGMTDIMAIAAGSDHNLVLTARPLILSVSPSVAGNIGDTVTFSVSATYGPLSYQWQRNGTILAGATNTSLSLTNVQATHGGVYRVLVRNAYGSVLSAPAGLTFPPPVITQQPASLTRYRGDTATLNVAATGIQPLTYQWRRGDTNISGATAATLILTSLRATNAGNYDVVVTDAAGGSAASTNATLTVIDPTLVGSVALSPSVDTSIYSGGTKPQGTASIIAGRRNNGIIDRALLRFNLNTIPSHTVIQSARLQLTVTRIPLGAINSNFSIYRMLRLWGADASWTSATAGAAWAGSGASSGVDFVATPTATHLIAGGGPYDFGPTSQLTADVQLWVGDPTANHGWLLKSESETFPKTARHFGSSETQQAPRLLIDYLTPATRPVLTNPRLVGGTFTFQFNGAPGWIYRVESQTGLNGAWSTVTNAEAGAATSPLVITVPHQPPDRFYRVLAE